jgi:hypothetical protein
MANQLSKRPFYVDTVGATLAGKVFPARVRWVGGALGNAAIIMRASGVGPPLWESLADAANYTDETYFDETDIWDEGFQVTTLGGGHLYIHIR